ncbi:MAG: hypothetical protein J2P48_20565, partial [Alphaproteobacteria bacterium]|nr:hypothetical protein [Alphaproteobacteria bacterium]
VQIRYLRLPAATGGAVMKAARPIGARGAVRIVSPGAAGSRAGAGAPRGDIAGNFPVLEMTCKGGLDP